MAPIDERSHCAVAFAVMPGGALGALARYGLDRHRRGARRHGRWALALALKAVLAELEDEEVALHDLDGDVVDRHLTDPAFESASMCMAVQDDVGTALADRRRH